MAFNMFRMLSISASAFAVAAGHAGMAQTTTSGEEANSASPEVHEIIVTAQKRREAASRVAISISAFGKEDLARQRITSAQDVIKLVPGFTYARSGLNTPIFTLRGIGFNTTQMSATSPVGVYVNEVAYAYPYMASGPLYDLERVEVLKGPQGTLYGRNTTGGLINYITARPTDRFQAGVTVDLGNYQTHNIEGYVSGPLSDTLALRLAMRTENSDKGWQRSVTRDDRIGEKNRFAARGTVVWEPVTEARLILTGDYWRDKSDPQVPQARALIEPPFPGSESLRAQILPSIITRDNAKLADWTAPEYPGPSPFSLPRPPLAINSSFYSFALRGEFDLSDLLTLTSITSYNHLRRDDSVEIAGAGLVENSSALLTGGVKSFQQEVRLSGDTNSLNWIVGGYYAHDVIKDNRQLYLRDIGPYIGLKALLTGQVFGPHPFSQAYIDESFRESIADFNEKGKTLSAFANAEFKFNDFFKVGGGLRYTSDKITYTGCLRDFADSMAPAWNYDFGGILGLSGLNAGRGDCLTFHVDPATELPNGYSGIVKRSFNEDNVSGRLHADWTPSADLLVYASASRGFKSGGFPLISIIFDTDAAPYRQEKVTSYELGVKSKLFSRKVLLNGAVFYYEYRNKQTFGRVLVPVFITNETIVNIPKSHVYGVESDISWRVAEPLTIRASATYLKNKITRYIGFDAVGNPFDFRGFHYNYVPKYQATASIIYSNPITQSMKIEASLDGSYQSQSNSDLTGDPQFAIGRYAILNGNIGLAHVDDKWRASLWVRNLTNKYYWISTFRLEDTTTRYAGMPRTYGLTLSYNFE